MIIAIHAYAGCAGMSDGRPSNVVVKGSSGLVGYCGTTTFGQKRATQLRNSLESAPAATGFVARRAEMYNDSSR